MDAENVQKSTYFLRVWIQRFELPKWPICNFSLDISETWNNVFLEI